MKKLLKMTSVLILSSAALFGGNSTKPNCCNGPVLCPTFPLDTKDDCCKRLHVDLGLIYQQPAFANMTAGSLDTVYESFSNNKTTVIETYDILLECFDYTLGLTASLGYLLEHDDWYFGTRFDWLSASMTKLHPSTDNVTQIYSHNLVSSANYEDIAEEIITDEEFNKVIYSANIDIYVLDVLLSRGSFHSKCFSYEPFAGVKALWFSTKQVATYYGPNSESSHVSDYGIWTEKQHNWGAGPMFGLNGEYYLIKELSIYSDNNIALLFGEADQKEINEFIADIDSSYDYDFLSTTNRNELCQIYIPIRTGLGLKFSRMCFDDAHYLALKIGYEVTAVLSYPATDRGYTMSGLYTNLIWNF